MRSGGNLKIWESPNNTIIIESPNVRRSLDSKILKTQILKDTVEKYILYLDSDIIVNTDLNKFLLNIQKSCF